MTIHPEHPFLPAGERDPVRRLRARLVTPVTIWATSTAEPNGRISRAAFTVGTTTIADGAPSCVLGMIDSEADVWTVMQRSGMFTVSLLQGPDRNLADVYAGQAPSSGGNFGTGVWQDTAYGPALEGRTWAGCRLLESRPVGYGLLVTAAIEEVVVDPREEDAAPSDEGQMDALARLRGRYTTVPAPRG